MFSFLFHNIDESVTIKKTWMGRIPMMKSLKKHSEDSSSITLSEQEGELDKMQFGVRLEDCFPSPHNQVIKYKLCPISLHHSLCCIG